MAVYNNGYPINYPQFYPNQQQQMQQQMYNPQMQAPQQTQQIQNGGFIAVANEDIARNYPVAPGNSVTFKCENAPYIYTKTMGFSQLDTPIFEKYKLVREEDVKPVIPEKQTPEFNINEFEEIKSQVQKMMTDMENSKTQSEENFNQLWSELNNVKKRFKGTNKKEEDGGN